MSAREMCGLLDVHAPTPEQEAVIEAPLSGVYRVIAGAGSGKTETMALRVLYLVANGFVMPRDVLGLTFTKKAAGELQKRLVGRLALLGERLPGTVGDDPFDRPRVMTYNAFSTRIFTDYAVYLGIDSDIQVASQASAWSLARQVVATSTDTRLASLDLGVDKVASLVVSLSQSLAENDVDDDGIDEFVRHFRPLRDLPPGGRGAYAEVDTWVDRVESLAPLSDLVRQFAQEKRERGIVEFGDQVRFALDVVRRSDQVVDVLRHDHRVVLLDEYQDTSVLQATLLSRIFSDHPVMAVGDPYQAIYGWRGASAGNLDDFPAQFAVTSPTGTFSLSTSWRNSIRVLEAANALAAPLAAASPGSVVTLAANPRASEGVVEASFSETVDAEATEVAEWFATRLAKNHADTSTPPTAALLLRNRRHQNLFVTKLRASGLPVHVLGFGGLLQDPLVADLVCCLAVVHRPEANSELVRLLAGGRYQVGVADLHALSQVAKKLARSQGFTREGRGGGSSTLVTPTLSLPETLEWLRTKPLSDDLWSGISPAGRERIRDAAELFFQRRHASHDDLIDQLVAIEVSLGLDAEVWGNPERDSSRQARGALFDAVSTYQATSDHPSASGFIDWLGEAEWRDNLQPRSEEAEPGCVQVLTIHGAKGLEWDYVAIPRLVADELPSKSRDGSMGWLKRGELPYPLRGDREHLPRFAFDRVESRKELVDSAKEFFHDVAHTQLREERRLMYVAVTRAKRDVGLFGSWWASQKTPRAPSIFVAELADAGLLPPPPEASGYETNPGDGAAEDTFWPGDPLEGRREVVTQSAGAVLDELPTMPQGLDPTHRDALDEVLARLRHSSPAVRPAIPFRLAASSIGALIADASLMMDRRARPLPRVSKGAERAGTDFHAWVEDHYRASDHLLTGGDSDLDGETGVGVMEDLEDLEVWRDAFLASPFATTTPRAIEREIHLPIAGHVVVCKIDAVFDTPTGVDIIDWKTGRPPANAEQERVRSLQLSLYRLAWAAWTGDAPETITAGWWFSRTAEVVRPSTLLSFDELEGTLLEVFRDYESSRTNSANA